MTGDVKYSADDFRIKASGAEVDAYFDKKGAALEAYGTGMSCAMVNVTLGDENDNAPQTVQLVAGKDGSDNNPVMTYLTVTPEDATLTGVGGAAYTPGSDDSIMTKRNVASYVDGAITEGVAAKCEIVVGSYTGEGVGKTRTVTLGFRPKAVIVADNLTRDNYLKPQDVNFAIDGVPSPCVTIIDTGFTVSSYFNGTNSDFGDLNPFRYIAFK